MAFNKQRENSRMPTNSDAVPRIVELTPSNYPDFAAHMQRHRAESGRDGFHFMPFAADDPEGPVGVQVDRLRLPLDEPGWGRAFVALEPDSTTVIGHVCIKGGQLRTMQHRCELGLGVEQPYRRQGLGERLMRTAIEFARQQPVLAWLDLSTFRHNLPARQLYEKLGFEEVGMVPDRIRIARISIDDVLMTLSLRA